MLCSKILPNLKRLHLEWVRLGSHAGFTHLTHLCLRYRLMSAAEILTLLHQTQALESVILSGIDRDIETRYQIQGNSKQLCLLYATFVSMGS